MPDGRPGINPDPIGAVVGVRHKYALVPVPMRLTQIRGPFARALSFARVGLDIVRLRPGSGAANERRGESNLRVAEHLDLQCCLFIEFVLQGKRSAKSAVYSAASGRE